MKTNLKALSLVGALLVGALLGAGAVKLLQPKPANDLGALPSNDLIVPYLSVNGREVFTETMNINQSSTTICSFRAPNASTTLAELTVNISVASSTPLSMQIGKATNPTATTTLLGTELVTAATTISASTTLGQAGKANQFNNGDFANVTYGGANGSLNTLQGTCSAVFNQNSR